MIHITQYGQRQLSFVMIHITQYGQRQLSFV